jgi:hypothetical protein
MSKPTEKDIISHESYLQSRSQIFRGTPLGDLAYEMWHCLVWAREGALGDWDPSTNFDERVAAFVRANSSPGRGPNALQATGPEDEG